MCAQQQGCKDAAAGMLPPRAAPSASTIQKITDREKVFKG
jgi:hypothetical protein